MARCALVVWLAMGFAPARAQQAGPQACAQDAARIDYGRISVGTLVVPQRHRYVGGDPNWDARQARFLGRVARVVRLSGLDARGCPGVRIDVDGGRYFWRARDLTLGAARPRAIGSRLDRIPDACGRTDADAVYGPVRVGSVVVLGRHRSVGGDENWTTRMEAYVGRVTRVVELAGADESGCPGVYVEADDGGWFWRVRDLRLADGEPPGTTSYEPSLASDHGRAAGPGATDPGDPRVPQECGLTDVTAQYGPVLIGREVILGRHRRVGGDDNWVPEMDEHVGRRARVAEHVGVDDSGCPLVRVDADAGEFVWRVRDLRLP